MEYKALPHIRIMGLTGEDSYISSLYILRK
nr:MAG TPA: hypothetical protein [Caudoviricetes sp.]